MAGIITALKIQKRDKERVSVYIDDEFAFGLSRQVAEWITVGQELSDEKIRERQEAGLLHAVQGPACP